MPSEFALLEKQVIKNKTPFVQYAFFDGTGVIKEYSNGYTDIAKRHPVDDESVFAVFSVTKTFTALAILQLFEKGRIAMNAPVSQYLSDLPAENGITVMHLLTHTAGLANPLPINWIHTLSEHSSFDRNEFFKPIIRKSMKGAKPGKRFRYSNIGYILLGQVIESVSGMSYETYVTKQILDRLTSPKAIITFNPGTLKLATGYHKAQGISMLMLGVISNVRKYMVDAPKGWKAFLPVYLNGSSYGGLFANVGGMVKYGRELLTNQHALLTNPSYQRLFTENRTTDNKPTGMCLSWFKGMLNGTEYYCHAGGGGGFYCELRLYPHISKGSFIVFNRSGFSDMRVLDKTDARFIS